VTEPRRSVPRKAQEAFRLMLQDPSIDLQKAALAVGTSTYNLRRLLKLPHIAKWCRAERSLVITELCNGNMAALKDVRDRSDAICAHQHESAFVYPDEANVVSLEYICMLGQRAGNLGGVGEEIATWLDNSASVGCEAHE
jgi:hypothetical protein